MRAPGPRCHEPPAPRTPRTTPEPDGSREGRACGQPGRGRVPPGPAVAVITMGCGDACPAIPGKKQLRADWDLPDPRDRPLEEVRATRDEIDKRVRALVSDLDAAAAA